MNRQMAIRTVLLVVFFSLLMVCHGAAAESSLQVPVGQSKIIPVLNPIRVVVADPTVADVITATTSEILILGKKVGSTTVTIWDKEGRETLVVEITQDDDKLSRSIEAAIANPDIKVRVGGKAVILEGNVTSLREAEKAYKIALAFSDVVINVINVDNKVVGLGLDAILMRVFANEPGLKATMVSDVMVLEGVVSSQASRDRIESVAKLLVSKVANGIIVTGMAQIEVYRHTAREVVVVAVGSGEAAEIK